jgi:hypothetical protein
MPDGKELNELLELGREERVCIVYTMEVLCLYVVVC